MTSSNFGKEGPISKSGMKALDMKTSKVVLPSGLTILFIPIPRASVFNIELTIRAGGLNEDRSNLGYFHFLEHLMAQFCYPQRPNPIFNQRFLEQKGIVSNAWTSEHASGYWMKGTEENTELMLEFMLNNFIQPIIPLSIFEKEKTSVIRELTNYINNPWYSLDEMSSKILYRTTTMALTIPEEIKNVERATPNSIIELRKKFYVPRNTLVAISGKFSKPKIRKYITDLFKNFRHEDPKYLLSSPFKIDSKKIPFHDCVFVPNKKVNDYKIELYFRIPYTRFNTEIFALECIENILTDGMAGILQEALRGLFPDPKGAVYSVHSMTNFDCCYPELSSYGINTTISGKYVKMAVEIIIRVLQNALVEGITKDQMERYKNKIALMLKQDKHISNPGKFTDYYTPFVLWNKRIRTREKEYRARMAMTRDYVTKIFRQVFTLNNFLLIYSGEKNLRLDC